MGARIKVAIGLLAALALAALGAAAYLAWPYFEDAPAMEAVRAMRVEPGEEVPQSVAAQQPQDADAGVAWPAIDWNALRTANPDVRAWVTVPGTRVDYAVVQAHADDPQRYLHRDMYGNASFYGCPYLDSACEDFGGIDGRAPIVYGHHLINGTMFSDFSKFSDRAYAEAHRQILLMTPEENRELRVVAVNVVDADYETIQTGFGNAPDLNAYYAQKFAESEVVLETPDRAQRIYAFVCCSYQTDNSRTIVYAIDAEDDPELKAEDDALLAREAAAAVPDDEIDRAVEDVLAEGQAAADAR